jgi:formate dehydrogenase subunit gamma
MALVPQLTREPWSEELVEAVVAAHRDLRGALMPILRGLQVRCGYVDPRSIPLLAEALNLSQAEVYGVVTFYRDFRSDPPGARVVKVCRAEACQSVGADALAAHARSSLGIEFGETTPDGSVSLDQVFCLGNCPLGPALLIDEQVHGRVTNERFDRLVNQ